MKFILKLLLAPLMLILWIVEWALTLALKASAVVCVIASALFLLSGFFYFVEGNVQNGCICLGIAFLIYLEEKGFADFDALVNAAADAEKRFYALKATIKAAEARMSEIQTLRTHIMNYSRTRSVYTGYRKAGYSKKYLAEHEGDILIHKAAKKAFDAFGLKKLPTVRSLNEEFARLLAEKKAAYAEYHRAQEQMRELLIHKANAAYLLGLDEQNRQTTERQREEK